MMGWYRTEMQLKITKALEEDVIDYVNWCRDHEGMTYRQIAIQIQGRTGFTVQPTTLSRWLYSHRTGR